MKNNVDEIKQDIFLTNISFFLACTGKSSRLITQKVSSLDFQFMPTLNPFFDGSIDRRTIP